MKEFDFRALPFQNAYKLLLGAVVPRPIAWVSTISSNGLTNLAPFSFFNAVCSNPPTLMFSVTVQPDLSEKDTLRNIKDTKEFVVHVVDEKNTQLMNSTSGDYPKTVSEIEALKIETLPSKLVKPPRIKVSNVHMECVLDRIIPIGDGSLGSATIVLGKVVYMHVNESVMKDDNIDTALLTPVARVAGFNYIPAREVFGMPRPKIDSPTK